MIDFGEDDDARELCFWVVWDGGVKDEDSWYWVSLGCVADARQVHRLMSPPALVGISLCDSVMSIAKVAGRWCVCVCACVFVCMCCVYCLHPVA